MQKNRPEIDETKSGKMLIFVKKTLTYQHLPRNFHK